MHIWQQGWEAPLGNRRSGNLWGALVTPGGLGQQQDDQCKQPNAKESSDKAALLERKTKKASVQRQPVCMFTGSAILVLSLVWQQRKKEKDTQRKRRLNENSLEREKPLTHHGTKQWLGAVSAWRGCHVYWPHAQSCNPAPAQPAIAAPVPALVSRAPWASRTESHGDFLTTQWWWGPWTRPSLPRDWLLEGIAMEDDGIQTVSLTPCQVTETSTIPAFNMFAGFFFCVANLKVLPTSSQVFTVYASAVFQADIPCSLFKYAYLKSRWSQE